MLDFLDKEKKNPSGFKIEEKKKKKKLLKKEGKLTWRWNSRWQRINQEHRRNVFKKLKDRMTGTLNPVKLSSKN